jgi:Uma2 family endonuclease
MTAESSLEALLGQLVRIESQLGPITAAQYERLDEDLCRQIEVVDGHAVYCEAPARSHNRAARRLANMIEQGARRHTSARGGCLSVDTDVDLRLHAVPLGNRRPDVVLYQCLDGDDPLRPREVLLVVEVVSPGSETTDTVTKFAEYAKAGIAHYWIVRLDETGDGTARSVGTIEMYRLDTARSVYAHDRTAFRSDTHKTETVGIPVEVTLDWSELSDLTGG